MGFEEDQSEMDLGKFDKHLAKKEKIQIDNYQRRF